MREGERNVRASTASPGGSGENRTRAVARRARWLGARVALVLTICAASLSLVAAVAAAETSHKFLRQITAAPLGTALGGPEALAVDKAGNLFVADAENGGQIDVFNSTGEYTTQFGAEITEGEVSGIAVDASGRVYVADTSLDVVFVFKPDGFGGYERVAEWTGANTPEEEFGEVSGVAIDNSESATDPHAGDVYVADRADGAVWIFKPAAEESKEGTFVAALKGKPIFEEPSAIAERPSTGQVYVATLSHEHPIVEVFSDAGAFETKIIGKATPTKSLLTVAGLAVEDSTGNVYVSDRENRAVDEFSATGEWLGWLTAAEPEGTLVGFASPIGVATTSSGGVYVADGGASVVDVFGPPVTVPDVATSKPTKVERTAAVLNGSINTKGKPSSYYFEYGEAEGKTLTTAVTPAAEGESTVQASISGLTAGREYAYRLIVQSEGTNTEGAVVDFDSSPAVSGVSTGPATSVTSSTATLTGSLDPQKIATKYRFEYGTTRSYGKQSPVPYGESSSSTSISAESAIGGLLPDTTYHYRLVAFNQYGITYGEDVQFHTSGPSIVNEPPEGLTHTSEKLSAAINPDKIAGSKYSIEYGETTSYGKTTTEKEIAGESEILVEEVLAGLKPATTYHYRVVLKNSSGTYFGPDEHFTTVLIDSESATAVTSEGATLQAQINPLGVDTKYHFEYGETPAYGTSVPIPDGDLGAGEGDQLAEAVISGLHPGTTYHYRVVASFEEGGPQEGLGADHTFTTGAPAPFTLPDGRAYEMVSPPNKHSGFVEALNTGGGAIQSSLDGNAFTYAVDGALLEDAEGNRSPEPQQIFAVRTPTGWDNSVIVTPHEQAYGLRPGNRTEFEYFTPDLALSVVQPFPFGLTPMAEPALAPPASEAERGHQEKTIYVRDDAPVQPTAAETAIYEQAVHNGEQLAAESGSAAGPGFVSLVSALNTAPGDVFGGRVLSDSKVEPDILFEAATPDLSHAIIHSLVPLVAQGPSARGLYEWGGGKLEMVSVLPAAEGGERRSAKPTSVMAPSG